MPLTTIAQVQEAVRAAQRVVVRGAGTKPALHPLILFDGREPGALHRAEALAGEISHLCIGLGGSITGEHGIGMEKRDYLPVQFAEADVAVMHRVRRALDPLEIANPGKMFPGGDAPALTHIGLHPLEQAGVLSRE